MLKATEHVAFEVPEKTRAGMERTHPGVWQASFSGLGGPQVATYEFGAWCSPAKVHTLGTLHHCGTVLGSGRFLRRQ